MQRALPEPRSSNGQPTLPDWAPADFIEYFLLKLTNEQWSEYKAQQTLKTGKTGDAVIDELERRLLASIESGDTFNIEDTSYGR